MLKESGYFKVGLFSDIRDIQLNQMILMVRVMQFRIDGLKFILNGFDDRNRAEGYSQELIVERINVLAHGLSCLVFGHEPDESSLQQAFIIDVVTVGVKYSQQRSG